MKLVILGFSFFFFPAIVVAAGPATPQNILPYWQHSIHKPGSGGGSPTCGGTINVIQSTGHTSVSGTLTLVTTNAVTAGHTLYIGMWGEDFTTNIVSDPQGNAWKLVRAYNAASFGNVAIFSSTAIGTGGSNYTVNINSPGTSGGALLEVEGTDCLGVEDGSDDKTGTSSTPNTDTVVTTADGFMLGVGSHDTDVTASVWSGADGCFQVYQQANNNALLSGSVCWKKTSLGVNNISWTNAESINWFATAVEFK